MRLATILQHEKLPDILLGLSLVGWAVAGTVSSADDLSALIPVRISLAVLQVTVGLLIMLRPRADEQGDTRAMLWALPSFLISGIMFRLAAPLEAWPVSSKWIFAVAVVWVLYCFWSLRRSFAILPARRAIVRAGAYRLLRHPAYQGEYAMACACAYAGANVWGLLCLAALLPLLVVRIRQEEALLVHDQAYVAYQGQVRWRLLPGVW